MKYLHKWLRLIGERFNPMTYSVMIFVFIGAHHTVYLNFFDQKVHYELGNLLYLTPLILAVFLFFFKLRLFDEVKDIGYDIIHHPERPLPRGILRKSDILQATRILILLEIILFGFYGIWSLMSAVFAVIYSLLMYKEFFMRIWLRSNLTIYALTHTFIVVFISIAIFSALLNVPFNKIPPGLINFSLVGWFLFNIFEIGRKTFARQEEKQGINSYSKVFGKFGSTFLVLAMAALSIIFMDSLVSSIVKSFFYLWFSITAIMGFLYAIFDHPRFAYTYRLTTSLYIIFIYGTVLVAQFF